jgi:hypothetical protein
MLGWPGKASRRSISTADLFIGYQTTEHIDEKFASFGPGWSVGPGLGDRRLIHPEQQS